MSIPHINRRMNKMFHLLEKMKTPGFTFQGSEISTLPEKTLGLLLLSLVVVACSSGETQKLVTGDTKGSKVYIDPSTIRTTDKEKIVNFTSWPSPEDQKQNLTAGYSGTLAFNCGARKVRTIMTKSQDESLSPSLAVSGEGKPQDIVPNTQLEIIGDYVCASFMGRWWTNYPIMKDQIGYVPTE